MVALYITATEPAAGKTTIGAGLGKQLQNNRQKVGYFKPLAAKAQSPDRDILFMKRVLNLSEAEDILSPVLDNTSNLSQAYAQVAQGKDVVIIEDATEQGKFDGIAQALNAKVMMVAGYTSRISVVEVIASSKELGKYLFGVVVNKVPRNRVDSVRSELSSQLGAAGIALLGVLPESRPLSALTVEELASHLQGEILNSAEKSAELVESFMLGTMGIDPGTIYFDRKNNKAVITRAERPDMQMAALETSTRCLVITGSGAPASVVLHRATEKQVPIIWAKSDIHTTIISIEEALHQTRFSQEKKLPRLAETMAPHFDFPALYRGLGLAG